MKNKRLLQPALALLFILSSSWSFGQQTKDSSLYRVVMKNDSLLFNIGFNTCDIRQFEQLLSEDFQFFHDKGGISDKASFLRDLRNGLCASPATYQSRRELVKGSTAIYPLYNNGVLYGIVQTGVHKFYENIAGQKERFASTAKFTHIWLLEGGLWKLNKGISYDHDTSAAQ